MNIPVSSLFPNFGSDELVNPSFITKEGSIMSLRQFTYEDTIKINTGDTFIHCSTQNAVFKVEVIEIKQKEYDRTPTLSVKIIEVVNSAKVEKDIGTEFKIKLIHLYKEVT